MEYQVDNIWGCVWRQEKQKKDVRKFIYETFGKKPNQMTEAEIFEGIKLTNYLRPSNSEMAPIFKTIDVKI